MRRISSTSMWLCILLAGCAAESHGPVGAGTADEGGDASGGGEGGTGSGSSSGSGSGSQIEPGQLTAGQFDDNLNPGVMEHELTTIFAPYVALDSLPISDRVIATVRDGNGAPLASAMVTVSDDSGAIVTLPTGTDGRVLLYPQLDGFAGRPSLRVSAQSGGVTETQAMPESGAWSFTLSGAPSSLHRAIDLAFVIDTTGSMGDELAYIESELNDIVSRVSASYPDASIRFGLVVYRDLGDQYVTRTFPFTTDLAAFQSQLSAQQSGGGGDYPEAAEQGLAAGIHLGWRDGNVARVLFHVADAPPHDEHFGAFLGAVADAREHNIRIYPVGASGVGVAAEYLMRLSAMTTLARYLFLTDDSGIGNTHEVPHIPCYEVERLNDLMVRTLSSEIEGRALDGDPAEVIRTVGTYDHGVCAQTDSARLLQR